MNRSSLLRMLFIVGTLLLPGAVAAENEAQPEETLPGFKPKQVYDANPVDNINLYNGDPQLVVPLGPEYPLGPGAAWRLNAYYSARIWHLFNVLCNTGQGGECGDFSYF